jgi:hypothetical protein
MEIIGKYDYKHKGGGGTHKRALIGDPASIANS